MLKNKTAKYLFFIALTGCCLFTIYISIILNSCIIGNMKRLLRNSGKGIYPLSWMDENGDHKYVRRVDDLQTIVRVVPLTWQQENRTELTPKYRFLRQQGLTPSRKLPDALIIGVKKGGTRALLEFIRLHPDVRAAGSEVHFFDKYYKKGFQWYRHRMPPTLEGQVTMEKTPSYFITKEVPKRVRNMNPGMKLIVVVRDPVTRAISDYAQAASKKMEMKKFEELAFENGTDGVVDTSWGPDFLGLKRIVTEKYFYFNATKGFPCLLKSEGRSSPHCLGKTKGRNHPRIDPYAVERLRNFYRPFNVKLYQMTGINFGWP